MTAEFFLDSNILLYAHSDDPAEREKRAVARDLLAKPGAGLSAQVLAEFYVNATAKLRPPVPHEQAVRIIERLHFLSILPLTFDLVLQSLSARQRWQISYWDAQIITAARFLGCATVFSEDLNDGRSYEGVRVTNPFSVFAQEKR